MATINEFVIPLLGLYNGIHVYEFDIDQEFFRHFEMSKIKEATLQLELTLEKRDSLVTLDFSCEGSFKATCDRCTQEIEIPLDFEERLYIKYGEASDSSDEDIIWLEMHASEIDLTDTVYELIHVHLPIINRVDCDSENYVRCDKEALAVIYNHEESQEDDDANNDLWQELKKIKFNK
jgi:uncharacterized metal-binding protein YceD (DUF177 family)